MTWDTNTKKQQMKRFMANPNKCLITKRRKRKGNVRESDMIKSNTGERIGKLETTVEGFHEQFRSMNATLEKIQDSLSSSKQTNWATVIAAIVLGLALWAAAIRPINNDVERQALAAEKIAEAVLVQNDKISSLQIDARLMGYRLDEVQPTNKTP
jgi:methyl-accepting chemotaxis protein